MGGPQNPTLVFTNTADYLLEQNQIKFVVQRLLSHQRKEGWRGWLSGCGKLQ
jgi:ATP adenylyltransferase/5',5'''-P-1,P-4-tetraphosphate phosphorylase II